MTARTFVGAVGVYSLDKKRKAMAMDVKKIIDDIYSEVCQIENEGAVASYIPELSNVDVRKFGVFISGIDEIRHGVGHCYERFSIQSISKVLSLAMVYAKMGRKVWKRVGVEPSGTAFNSLVQIEADHGIPRNPFINAGALVVTDMIMSLYENPQQAFLDFVRSLSNGDSIQYSHAIAESERSVGYRNAALCNLIKSYGNIENDPEEVLQFYYEICSIELSCQELSDIFLFLANKGNRLLDGSPVMSRSRARRMNALMQTCGFYDESGEFAFKVGLPGKSGVGGGIIAVHPDEYVIAVWSPKLNSKGNSYRGVRFLELFTSATHLSIF